MTSAVAYTLHRSGYFLGDTLGELNYEDQELLRILPRRHLLTKMRPDEFETASPEELIAPEPTLSEILDARGLTKFIAERNRRFRRWGFKLPHASEYCEDLLPILRNPIFVFCIRNPVATCRSLNRREQHMKNPLSRLREIQVPLLSMLRVARRGEPFIAVNMDEAKRRPGRFANEISETLALEASTEIRKEITVALGQPGYKRAARSDAIVFKPQ